MALVGWLWADILLGLFVIFLAAASPPVKLTPQAGPSIDPTPITLDIDVDGPRMLGADTTAAQAEQTRFADAVKRELLAKSEARKVALVFAYGWNQDAALGQQLALRATDALPLIGPQFQGAVMRDLHDIHPGDPGTKVSLEIYVYR
jgi:hypothetical protein